MNGVLALLVTQYGKWLHDLHAIVPANVTHRTAYRVIRPIIDCYGAVFVPRY